MTASRARPRRRFSLQQRKNVLAYLFLAPTLVGLVVFLVVPLVWGIGISFTNYMPGVEWKWVGLENYRRVFTDRVVRAGVPVVLKYSLGIIPWLVVVSLFLAFPLNRNFRGIGLFRAGVYFPHITSMVVVATVFIYLYKSNGLFNELLGRVVALFGGEWKPISFLQRKNWALWGVIFVTYFKSTGYYAILYLAGLQNVSQEIVEAAMIDGANWMQRLWFVILPSMRAMATLVVVLCIIGGIKLFGEVYVMTNGGPGLSTQSPMLTIYQEAFTMFRFGYASALAIVVASVALLLTLLSLKISERSQT